jgi:hypothetical protein
MILNPDLYVKAVMTFPTYGKYSCYFQMFDYEEIKSDPFIVDLVQHI